MIVMKFGGTSLQDAASIRRAADIVHQRRSADPVVVVSAIGSTTQRLLELGHAALADGAAARKLLDGLLDHHRSVLADLDVAPDAAADTARGIDDLGQSVARLLEGIALLRELTPRTEDAIMSHGERLSSLLFAAAAGDAGLDVVRVDAASVIVTDARFRRARPDRDELRARARATLQPLIEQHRIPVLEGFIGATAQGVPTTMGFEASDYTASLLGAALDADEIQIWTDVGGILTTGRSDIAGVSSIGELSFREAAELSFFGAKVLHPDTIDPAAERGIPVRILHAQHPEGAGTTIFGAPAAGATVKSIALKEDVIVVRATSRRPMPVHRIMWSIGESLDRHELSPHLLAVSGHHVVLAVAADPALDAALGELGDGLDVSRTANCVIVSLVGAGVGSAPAVAARATQAAADGALLLLSYGASDTSVSLVVSEKDVHDVVVKLHEAFFGDGIPEGVFQRVDAGARR